MYIVQIYTIFAKRNRPLKNDTKENIEKKIMEMVRDKAKQKNA